MVRPSVLRSSLGSAGAASSKRPFHSSSLKKNKRVIQNKVYVENDKPSGNKMQPDFSAAIDSGWACGKLLSCEPGRNVDHLVSQLHNFIENGRIFDARDVVHKLQSLERNEAEELEKQIHHRAADTGRLDSPIISKVRPIHHIFHEVLSQSTHVENLLNDLHSNDNWILAKEKSGVVVHYRREIDSPIHTVRAQSTFENFHPEDFVKFCSLFVETELMPQWFPGGILKKANVLSWHSKYSKVVQLQLSLGLPLVAPRDAIVYGNGYHLPDRNAFLISSKPILNDSNPHCDIPSPEKGTVRMTTESIFYVELTQSNAILFKLIGRDDLKFRHTPSALLNYIAQGHMPFDLTKSIHQIIRNFKGSVWETKIKERGDYYKEIEDKVYDQLQLWKIEELKVPMLERNVVESETTKLKSLLQPPTDPQSGGSIADWRESVLSLKKSYYQPQITACFLIASASLFLIVLALCSEKTHIQLTNFFSTFSSGQYRLFWLPSSISISLVPAKGVVALGVVFTLSLSIFFANRNNRCREAPNGGFIMPTHVSGNLKINHDNADSINHISHQTVDQFEQFGQNKVTSKDNVLKNKDEVMNDPQSALSLSNETDAVQTQLQETPTSLNGQTSQILALQVLPSLPFSPTTPTLSPPSSLHRVGSLLRPTLKRLKRKTPKKLS